ncbi:SMI1 / KNR4 family protein [Stieleria maiorica]|uniref:SMI1 / KNR4 family protein n=1 Tax=Stieleria maiorica TaxID=2795974 RepID=A0A5B9ML34_9BACT|nr:SMI1/KNR4 family protein [Stieleria maiorica]QEG00731.1 SMI1 / KNR4 family protein [Stieleria maiorica]
MPFPVDSKWITKTENKLGVRFPASFVAAMSEMNGGSVRTRIDDFNLFPFLDASDRKRIQRTCGSIDRETTTARKDWTGFPPDAVAIGANGGGDLLVLIPMPDESDSLQHSVYWWDHETGDVELVADDFGDLPKT